MSDDVNFYLNFNFQDGTSIRSTMQNTKSYLVLRTGTFAFQNGTSITGTSAALTYPSYVIFMAQSHADVGETPSYYLVAMRNMRFYSLGNSSYSFFDIDTSTDAITVIQKPTKDKMGLGRFHFSDRFSVFDWGEMPNHLDHKGEAIALLSAYFFEKLEKQGVATHYVGLVEDGAVKKLNNLKKPSNIMEIKLLRVIRPELKGEKYD
jgi:hypothetical protein